ncbi:MAG TPA: PAS domain-containing protein [Chroococcidiopsis sp.]
METTSPNITANSDYLRQFVMASTDLWAECDRQLRYVAINPSGLKLLHCCPQDAVGKSNAELATQSTLSELTQRAIAEMHHCLQRSCDTGTAHTAVHRFMVNGITETWELSYTPVLAEGELVRIFVVGHISRPLNAIADSTDPHLPMVGAEMPHAQMGVADAASRVATELESSRAPAEPKPSSAIAPRPGTAAAGSEQSSEQESEQAMKIRQPADLLQLVLDNIPQYIFWKDRDSTYQGCNRRWAEMAGIGEPENVIGLTDYDLPWTTEQTAWYLECDRQVMETNTPMLRIKQSQLQADGRLTWREVNKIPILDGSGTVIGMLGTIEDITERTLAEELLRQSETKFKQLAKREELLNSLTAQIRKSLDLNTILNTVVKEVRHLLDTDRALIYQFDDQWRGRVVVEDVVEPWISTLGELGADSCFQAEYAQLYEGGRTRAMNDVSTAGLDPCHADFLGRLQVRANLIVPITIRSKLWGMLIVHECGQPRAWQEWEVSLLKQLADQTAIAIKQAELYRQATKHAIDAQSQAEQLQSALQELKSTQAQLVQTEKMSGLGQLVAGIAHEINNPVNFIYGNIIHINGYINDLMRLIGLYQAHYPSPHPEIVAEAEAIDLEFLLQDLFKILDSVRIGTERIRQIVLSLRNFSRIDESGMKAVDIHEGIDSTLLILQHRLKQKIDGSGIRLVKQYGPLPPVECYAGQLNQVFMNLISNALDALESTDSGRSPAERQAEPSQITITTELSEQGDRVLIRIQDSGPGIPAAMRSRLFEPFFTTKPIGKGTGLGLSISHQIIVEKHGGRLTCESEPGQGAVFCIEIPIQSVASASPTKI